MLKIRSPPAQRTNYSSQPMATPTSLSGYKMQLKGEGRTPNQNTNPFVDFTSKVMEATEGEEVRTFFQKFSKWTSHFQVPLIDSKSINQFWTK